MNTKTDQAIDALYDAFSDVARPHLVEGCPCCIEKKTLGTLLSKPLREITDDELCSYASSLFLTVGTEADFRYFLPRIFEVSATVPGWWPDPEVAIGKLGFVDWMKWEERKVAAIESYLDAVFEEQVGSGSSSADSWFCALARSKCGFQRYWERLKKMPKGLISVYESNSASLMKGKLSNSFWSDVPEEERKVIEWFGSEEARPLIDAAYAELYASNTATPGFSGHPLNLDVRKVRPS